MFEIMGLKIHSVIGDGETNDYERLIITSPFLVFESIIESLCGCLQWKQHICTFSFWRVAVDAVNHQRWHLICKTTGCAQFKVRKISILFIAHFQEHQDVCILFSLLLLTLIIPRCNAVPVNSIFVISYVVSVHLPTSPQSPSPAFLHWAFIPPDF